MTRNTDMRPPVGWPLLPIPDENGDLKYPGLEESIQQTIKIVLQTRPGEQLMRPGFGAGLENFLHAPNTLTTRSRIRDLIDKALERWEKRIQVSRIDVDEIAGHPDRLRIEISYRLKRTGIMQQMGITMEMEA